jgi:S1-C subfamily serine protease
MQDGRDHESESPERDPAPPGSSQPAPSAGTGPEDAGSPGASWLPFSMTSPEEPPGPAQSGEPPQPAGPGTPGAQVPPASGESAGTWPGQPGYDQPSYGPPGYTPPAYGPPPGYAPPGYGQPGYAPPQPGYGQPGYDQGGQPTGESSPPWQGQQGTQPIWSGPPPQQPWGPPPPGGPPYGGQPQAGGAWPPYPAELSGGTAPAGQGQWAPPPGGGYGQQPPGQPPSSRGPGSRALVYLLVAVLAAAVGAGAVFALRGHPGNAPAVSPQDIPKPRANTSGNANTPGLNVTAVADKVEPGMVDITSRLKLSGQVFEGTGMVLSSTGLVLTNNHVIDGATGGSLRATLVDGNRTYPAQVVGWDQTQDVALLKLVGASGLKTVQVGNSSRVKLGNEVVALGNAGGQGGSPTVTSGKITSLNRTITASDAGSDTSETLHGMFQTSAPIAPGDSGGPLANPAGQVIGMNTAANSQNLGPDNSEGFSIPIDRALALVRQMAAGHGSGSIHIGQPAFIGIAIASTPNGATSTATSPRTQLRQLEKLASLNGGGLNSSGQCLSNDEGSPVPNGIAPASSGALVGAVFCSTPANATGLRAGDVIVAVDGHAVTSATSLHAVISNYHPGNTVAITWVDTSGTKHTGSLKLAAGPVK